ncbi:ribosome alternative rescue factor ArfA [Rheinheimera maricola]|uniref:Ribosome alternative rescue factor ArfA n=1 Tax=Rheinheimera maricola TaxID=2793282 RepID=A0ABS7XD94_9GAMM|nr:ribosome alternative rescue factor ArfA [Rheinheimera maricola]MBZ9613035.1 ribosome alternative rescue factor ArfA [Rheinheimera maricola]
MSKPAAFEHGRGEIRDNAIKALVTSKLFQTRAVKAKKGKGSYNRKGRNSKDYALVVSMLQQLSLNYNLARRY